MSKHTPGPWSARINYFSRWEIFGGKGQLANVSTPTDPASPPNDWSECAANGRLIAAAPDLLEALKAMRIVMDSGDKPEKLDAALSWRECDERARYMCDQAILKATGESA